MTILVKMPVPRRSNASFEAPEGGAKILFFTGVRYVRDERDVSERAVVMEPAAMSAVADIAVRAVI